MRLRPPFCVGYANHTRYSAAVKSQLKKPMRSLRQTFEVFENLKGLRRSSLALFAILTRARSGAILSARRPRGLVSQGAGPTDFALLMQHPRRARRMTALAGHDYAVPQGARRHEEVQNA